MGKFKTLLLLGIFISNINAEDFSIKQGWNFYGAPTDIELNVFDNSCVDYLWKYNTDNANGRIGWQGLVVNKKDFIYDGTQVVAIKKNDGFWIKANNDCNVTINDVNFATTVAGTPIITSDEFNITENNLAIADVISTLPISDTSYKIIGGDDYKLFKINSADGFLYFANEADFETPKDANKDNVYNVRVEVSKGELKSNKDLYVRVLDDDTETIKIVSRPYVSLNGYQENPYQIEVENNKAPVTVTIDISKFESGTYDTSSNYVDNANKKLIIYPYSDNKVFPVTITATDGVNTDIQTYSQTSLYSFSTRVAVVQDSTPLAVNATQAQITKLTLTDNDNYRIKIDSEPTHGILLFKKDGSIYYRANSGYSGSDTFSYSITDGIKVRNKDELMYSNSRVVNITVGQ